MIEETHAKAIVVHVARDIQVVLIKSKVESGCVESHKSNMKIISDMEEIAPCELSPVGISGVDMGCIYKVQESLVQKCLIPGYTRKVDLVDSVNASRIDKEVVVGAVDIESVDLHHKIRVSIQSKSLKEDNRPDVVSYGEHRINRRYCPYLAECSETCSRIYSCH